LRDLFKDALEDSLSDGGDEELEGADSVEVSRLYARSSSSAKGAELEKSGMQIVSRGGAAICVLGGGMGTELGFEDPKGCYDLGLPSGLTLFGLLAARLRTLGRLAAAPVRILVMTSAETHDPTVAHFERNEFFGFPPGDVVFFQQHKFPCLAEDGEIILKAPAKVAWPDVEDRSGFFAGLQSSGALAKLEAWGVEWLHVVSVDNALSLPCYPSLLAKCAEARADVGAVACSMRDQDENIGIFRVKDKNCFIARGSSSASGTSALGDVGSYVFSVPFLRKASLRPPAHHVKRRGLQQVLGKDGRPTMSATVQLESYLSDAFQLAQRTLVFEVAREDFFAPVLDLPGTGPDTPDAARAAVLARGARWLTNAGVKVVADLEVSPALSYNGEGLDALRGQAVGLPGNLSVLSELPRPATRQNCSSADLRSFRQYFTTKCYVETPRATPR
jgi:UDP-N-acetylglucosamine/UDP-N-acetylgalactosamine diphosphorylase